VSQPDCLVIPGRITQLSDIINLSEQSVCLPVSKQLYQAMFLLQWVVLFSDTRSGSSHVSFLSFRVYMFYYCCDATPTSASIWHRARRLFFLFLVASHLVPVSDGWDRQTAASHWYCICHQPGKLCYTQ